MIYTFPNLSDVDLHGKRVVLRADLDVTVVEGEVVESVRLFAALKSIKALQEKQARIVVIAHRGRPNGVESSLSLEPVSRWLAKKCNIGTVRFQPMRPYDELKEEVDSMALSDVLVLENLRFLAAEKENDEEFSKHLSSLADIYVNDAFGTSHRSHASMVGIPKFIPGYIGPHLQSELEALEPVRKPKRKPYVVIIGGAKITSKLEALKSFLHNADRVFVGGAIATTFYKAKGLNIGRSFYIEDDVQYAEKLLASPALRLPLDLVVKNSKNEYRSVSISEINENESIVDIGPESVKQIGVDIKAAELIVWNGPVGLIEDPRARTGSDAIAHIMAERSRGNAYGVVGGGHTVDVISELNIADLYDHVSTGGGAMLKYVGGELLPALEVLRPKS
jgi:phosphoglycerate kinase